MGKRTFSILLALALVAGVFSALPANAQDAIRAVPAEPNIVDDHDDANGLTPQGGPAGGVTFSRADIWAGWFTVDATSLYAHVQISLAGRANYPYFYRVRVDPDAGSNCLWMTATVPSAVDPGAPTAQLRNTCGGDARTPGEALLEEGPEGSGVVTMKFPRSDHAAFADGGTLKAPWAEVTQWIGASPVPASITAPVIDMTDPGTDYVVGSGGTAGPAPEPKEEPPGKSDPPGKGKKKGCKKGKGKKKGACPGTPKPPVAPVCPAYVPGEEGAEVETTTIVTDAATEEKPVEVPIEAGAGIGVGGLAEQLIAHAYQNVQVDSASASTGLYVRLEMPFPSDYDLYVRNPDGSEAARAAGFNPAPVVFNDTGAGGHTEEEAEQIDGVRTADCQGYTIDVATATGEGGELLLKFWLGEATYPAEEGEGEALSTFFGLLGINR